MRSVRGREGAVGRGRGAGVVLRRRQVAYLSGGAAGQVRRQVVLYIGSAFKY